MNLDSTKHLSGAKDPVIFRKHTLCIILPCLIFFFLTEVTWILFLDKISLPCSASVGQPLGLFVATRKRVSSKLRGPGSVCQMLSGHIEHRRSFYVLGGSKILSFHATLSLLESDQGDNIQKPQRSRKHSLQGHFWQSLEPLKMDPKLCWEDEQFVESQDLEG